MSASELILIGTVVVVLVVSFRRLGLAWGEVFLLPLGAAAVYLTLRLTVMQPQQAAASAIFLLAYALIAGERVHKTKVALAGAVIMLLSGLVPQQVALQGSAEVDGIDWNTIFLLIGMMVIVNITRQTGLFQWLAIKAAKAARGEPLAIAILMSLITAALSAGLDNVTTVLLIAPVALLIAVRLQMNPLPFLICIILSSNIGGTATLIGDPPNILIGSAAHFTFLDFLRIDGPVSLVSLLLFLLTLGLTLGRSLRLKPEQKQAVMALDEAQAIQDPHLLWRAVSVIALTLVTFGLHSHLGLQPASIAMGGAALMLLMHHEGPEEALREVEWPTIFFFVGLFIMVSALINVGVVGLLGEAVLGFTRGNLVAMTMLVLWFSGLASGVVDNIPFVATMVALIHRMAQSLHPEAASLVEASQAPDILPLWWALSLGACLGGNLTMVGASANLIVGGIAERAGHPINFITFMKYGVPVTIQGLILSSIWLWFVFLRH